MWSRLNQNATEKTKLSVLEAENRELKNARPQALASSKDSAVAFDPSLKPDSYTACCYTEQTIDHFTEDHTIDYEHMTRVLWRQYVVDQAKSFKNSP
ncbi:hypothetical protein PC111_g21815 [Phytophthora cactorum]|nr:hypothetical protein PC111_g21815 [Phytophthora cactorum]